ncbi:MAG: MFS transporter [Actinobacteria bacterium]|nr:MFS transporter [Actinomycetota bacterium]
MSEKIGKNPLAIVIFTIFVDLLGYGILIPVIPLLLADPASSYYLLPAKDLASEGYFILGMLLAVYPFFQFLATPILGQLSDKFGRKKILAFSLFGTFLSYIIFALGIVFKNIPLLFFARAVDGITGGNISVAQASIADITKPEDRAKNFGLIGAAFGLGFIIGPYLGGKLSDPKVFSFFNATTPFWFAAILSILNVLSVIFFFPETLTNLSHHLKINWTKSIANIVKAYSMEKLKELFFINFLFTGGFTFFTTFFSVYLILKFGFTQGNIGDFFAYIGIWVAFTQIYLTRKFAKKFNETNILSFSIIGLGVATFLYFLPTSSFALFFIAPLFAICNGLTQANLLALTSRSAPSDIQGEILGINASVAALAMTIPPLLSGIIAADISPYVPVLIASIITVSAGILFIYFSPRFNYKGDNNNHP